MRALISLAFLILSAVPALAYSEVVRNGDYLSNHCPTNEASGNYALFILFFSALLCGLSAFYFDWKWPGYGPLPLIVFALIAVVCAFQFYRLSSNWMVCYSSTSINRRPEGVLAEGLLTAFHGRLFREKMVNDDSRGCLVQRRQHD